MKSTFFIIGFIFLFSIFIIGATIWFFINLRPVSNGKMINFEIKEGSGYKTIAANLKEKNLIRSKLAFEIYVLSTGRYNQLKAGKYLLSGDDSVQETTITLVTGKITNYRVTIPEGLTIKEMDQYLGDQYAFYGIKSGQFESISGELINLPNNLEATFPQIRNKGLEGFYLGDTFYFTNKLDVNNLKVKMLENFSIKALPYFSNSLPAPLKNNYEVLILASLVEKEAISENDRKIVAGIFLNRLKAGSLLESCASINYILPEAKKILSADDLAIDSSYNTYLYRGLTPTPISNPSLSSIKAVFNPIMTDYYYFLSDKSGKLYFAKTYEEHLRNRSQYISE